MKMGAQELSTLSGNIDAKNEKEKRPEIADDIEFILNDIGSTFGTFQLFNYCFYSIPIMFSGLLTLVYVFTTLNVDHRCYIPECDGVDSPRYDTDWSDFAIPFAESKPSKCNRYEYIANDTITQSVITDIIGSGSCSKNTFNRSHVIRCDENNFVYRTDEISIVNEFDITCEENEWKLAAVGAINNVARLLFLPLAGIISDRYGRRTILLISLVFSSIAGVVQSFSVNYTMFLICEVFCAIFACPGFTSALMLAIEWTGSKERAFVNSAVTFPVNIGVALFGVVAWLVQDFRQLLRWAYGPTLLAAFLVYLSPESLRWLMAKGKRDSIEKTLRRAAKINKVQLSPRTFEIVDRKCREATVDSPAAKITTEDHPLKILFSSRTMVIRAMINALCWITGNYTVQGIAVVAVSLKGDKYMNYIIIALGGTPSAVISNVLLKFVGRRLGISICFLAANVTVIVGKILPNEYETVALILFLNARCLAVVAYLIVYVHTSELWPTSVRHTMVSVSSTLGRLGSVMAAPAPFLSSIAEILPFLSFGILSLITGLLVLLLPETNNTKLPETIHEAKCLGKNAANVGQ